MSKINETNYAFISERLNVVGWNTIKQQLLRQAEFIQDLDELLSPAVTQNLPDHQQPIEGPRGALEWINTMANECELLVVQTKSNNQVIGFLLLYQDLSSSKLQIRIGYLLGEKYWHKGYASELIKGLIKQSETLNQVQKLVAGVESQNLSSMKVLLKNQFTRLPSNSTTDKVVFFERQILPYKK